MRLLLVEDDRRLADVLRRSLVERGAVVDVVHDGATGYRYASTDVYDAVILDVMLPVMDGLCVASLLRKAANATPILMLTARDAIDDIVAGLDAGADDYLCKPFKSAELEARLRSVARRAKVNSGKMLVAGGVSLDMATGQACRGTRTIALTAREAAFLRFFLCHTEQIVSRSAIENALWDEDRDSGASNIIDVYVARLRAKLTIHGEEQVIHTIRGMGYRFGAARA